MKRIKEAFAQLFGVLIPRLKVGGFAIDARSLSSELSTQLGTPIITGGPMRSEGANSFQLLLMSSERFV